MKNLKKVSRSELRTIKGGYRSCIDGCNFEIGEMCCSGVCRIGVVVPTTDPDFPEFTVCPKKP
ncbi:bacteriocin-like protein [Chryseobacterium sp. 'Rf worker isolate 10']|uniref:bacteriocin-like protein n=1 Tax=Chryseobacterium sp. 'Rf worker isolate 10' TaxID=2887348 RepID=UPI003D6ED49D